MSIFLGLAALTACSGIAIAAEERKEEALDLIGPLSMKYFKETSSEIHRPAILRLSLSPLLGGKSAEIPVELNEGDMPHSITLDYVKTIISGSPLLKAFIAELKATKAMQAAVKVSLAFEAVPDHREKINGTDVLNIAE
jgi:hypothetical protein